MKKGKKLRLTREIVLNLETTASPATGEPMTTAHEISTTSIGVPCYTCTKVSCPLNNTTSPEYTISLEYTISP